ncbi:MAG TPA: ABC transporter ATP-binding protein [Thermodesulfovibrionales bacterium]|nr:ABC transporter ATP-binding protein [Thermodesulfovibrionales bacterium]
MSSDVVISVEGLWKQYRYGTISHATLRKDIQSWWARFRGKDDPNLPVDYAPLTKNEEPRTKNEESEADDRFWALQDVNFEVKRGEVLGIIGRNGAGKSTLLKIMSRVTTPTKGQIKIKGRVASLLEVGTGFHPELTGGENIYLNGAILGMTKDEITKKFDEIVAFAEVEKFVDTPVKRYSSGMYVRLAFAVAAHLEPEILIIDEVLAVGDAQFQKKCLGKMEDVAKEGRTVLFVSHNMASITSLCKKSLLLDAGLLAGQGKTSDIVLMYYSRGMASPASFDYSSHRELIGDAYASLLAGSVVDKNNVPCSEVDIREPIRIKMKYQINRTNSKEYFPNFHIFSSDGTYAFVSSPQTIDVASLGIHEAECIIPNNFLNEGTYFVGLALTSFESGVKVHFYENNALSFNVKDPLENVPTRRGYVGPMPGVVRPLLDWTVRRVS